ncbi:winged helix-turn-helix transcriptional regulator [Streptomyces fructofermentans]|uniref:Transcriptional regulator n=1 Tax=Streptomyces fructofermentans TaxID=152141 RepID=A0A918KUT4_9ACTN|nr:winged helix-turn-helix transcriptional regulator [Streptomyces fructofermentans]GGX76635.1 transcriptional regulator [Streptomyces fructofermentans]
MSQRSYEDSCGAARAMDVVGERWALLIVRELLFGPKRFRDLRDGLPRASQNVLSQRLKELEADGIVRRVQLGPPVSAQAYELMERGRELEPVLMELARWGARAPAKSDAHLSTDAFMLLLKASHRRPGTNTPATAVRVLVGTDAFDVEAEGSSIRVGRATASKVDATVRSDVVTMRDLMFTGRTVSSAIADGTLEVGGDRSAAERFFTLFATPQA